MAKKSDYFGLSWVVSLILAIIPITSVICGIVQRFMDGKVAAGVLRLVLLLTGIGGLVVWVVDLVLMITKKHIWRLINA